MSRINILKIIPVCILALFVLSVYPAIQVHADLEDEAHSFVQADIRAYCNTYSTEFLYDDRMFLEDARSLSTDVAKASLGMAIGAYREDCMSEAYRKMEMEKVDGYWTYGRSESIYDNDYAAYTIARKSITDENGEEYILYVIPVKGTSKNAEWYSNFNLGKSGDHEGFYLAEKEILHQLVSYTDSDSEKYDRAHRIIWVTGHSRGAAIANILAGELTDNHSKWFSEALDIAYPEHIFGYTFACPNVSKRANQSYTNIWNFNNPGDVVPSVPLRSWGYYRYGQTIDEMDNIDNISQRFMEEHNGGVDSFDSLQSTKEFESTLSTLVVNEEDFHSDDNRLIFLIGAYFLGGNTDTSFYDLLVYAGRDENTWIMKQIAAAGLETVLPGSTEVIRMVRSISNDADRFNAFFNSGIIEETYGMTNEEFSEWVSEHQSEINEIESAYKLNIETRADLIACMSVNSEVEAGVTQTIQLIEKACRLFYLTDGQITGVIEHGHTQATYGCWINSLYYGYEGWKGYDEEIAVSIPDNINHIGHQCFYDCDGLTEISLNSSTTKYDSTIEPDAFYSCENLSQVTLPSEVTKLGYRSFGSCPGLREVILPGDVQYDSYYGYGPFSETTGIEKATYIKGQSGLLRGSNTGNYTIAMESEGSLKEIVIGEGITEIEKDAFRGKGDQTDGNGYCACIETVIWPSTLEKIGSGAFLYQDNLTKLRLPESVREIGDSAFAECNGLEGLLISNDTANIYYAAIPSGERLTIYGGKSSSAEIYANGNNNRFVALNYPYIELYEVQMNAGFTQQLVATIHKSMDETVHAAKWSITGNASENTHINENGLLSIAKEETSEKVTVTAVFEDVSNSVEITILPYEEPLMETPDFVLPASLDQIEEEAFAEIPANVVYIPDGCTSIGARAFKDCKNLKQIRIPDGCGISETAFEGCGSVIVFGTLGSPAEEYCRTEGNERFLFVEDVNQ